MADAFKILGQLAPTDTSEDELYVVPVTDSKTVGGVAVAPKALSVTTQTVVHTIIVCNLAGNTPTFDIRLKNAADDADVNQEYLFKSVATTANSTRILSLGLTLSAGNQIKVKTSIADEIAFTAMGIEVT
jgi:hypothetical protein